MARPLKDGVDYWPLDIDFLTCDEIRMIRQQYGAKGVLISIALINECYKSAGYFKQWDDDSCLLMADAVSCGITPELISQVLQECIRRGLFDEVVFSEFCVITSAGIQRRYLRMIGNRSEIEIIKEYWLLDLDSRKDVPASVLDKLTFKCVKSNFKGVKSNFNPKISGGNPQSKVKESKGKKSKDIIQKNSFGEFSHVCMTDKEYEKLISKYQKQTVDNKIAYLDSNIQSGVKKYMGYKDHYATIGNWCRMDAEKQNGGLQVFGQEPETTNAFAYALEE